jgi:hypothetical protein
MSFIPFTLELAFAGVWQYILHWGIGVALLIGLLAAAYFTTAVPLIGPYLTGLRKDLLWAAFGVAVFMGGEWIGQKDATLRCVSKQEVVEEAVKKAVKQGIQNKTSKDPWDNKDN